MRKFLACYLLLGLLLGFFAGCSRHSREDNSAAVIAPELLPTGSFEKTALPLGSGYAPDGRYCLSGEVLYFTTQKTVEDGLETALYAADANTGTVSCLATYLEQTQPGKTVGSQVLLEGFFSGESGTVWVAETAIRTRMESDQNQSEDGTVPESVPVSEEHHLLRQLSVQAGETARMDVTASLTRFSFGLSAGKNLLVAADNWVIFLTQDGMHLATFTFPSAVLFLTRYRGIPAVGLENEYGRLRLIPMDAENLSQKNPVDLPFSLYAVSHTGPSYHSSFSAGGTQLYFSCQGNLFACSADTSQVRKLLEWLDHGVSPTSVVAQAVTEEGRVIALHTEEDGSLCLLRMDPAGQKPAVPEALTLGTLSTDINTLKLVLEHNTEAAGKRVRVVNYGEYAAMGQTPQAVLTTALKKGQGPDLLYSGDRDLPVTELAGDLLTDLYPYVNGDAQLQQQGLLQSVLAVQESEGRLLSVAPSFVFSTAISNRSLIGSGTLSVARAMGLYASLSTYNSSAQENFARQETVLREHIARNSLHYGTAENQNFNFNNAIFQEALGYAAQFPKNIDWSKYDAYGSTAGWARVRKGEQLFFSGEYYGFSTLSQALYSVGDGAVLCGYPDVQGGHVLEIWNTFGMLKSCPDPDAGWDFLRKVLLSQTQTRYPLTGFPSNLTAFAVKGQQAMTAEGTRTLTSGDQTVTVPGQLSQSQYNEILAAVEKTTARYHMDYEVFEAVWTAVKPYFDGKADLSTAAAAAQNAARNYHNPDAVMG